MRLTWKPWRGSGVAVAVAALSVSACLGRSGVDDPDLVLRDGGPDVAGGRGGSGGFVTTGGAGGGGSGGTGGRGGSGGSGGAAGAAAAGGVGGGGTGGAPACGAENCLGCCDRSGTCHEGDALDACGARGVVCVDCSALGFGCVSGTCEGPPPPCMTSCLGCCEASGRCRLGTESDACGTAGAACQNCAASAQGCVASICQGPPPPTCGPSNCGGCCDASGVCRTGDSDAVCGAGGVACQSCTATGRRCNQPGSYCAFFPTCGAVTCPTGCCDAQGTCRSGRTDAQCGSSGQRCTDCTASNQACAVQGYCYSGPHCGADNCAGCCTTTGQCLTGSDSSACGQFGVLCDNCTAKAQTCQNQVCAGSSTCPAAYAGCNPAAATPPPFTSASCSAAELSSLATACRGAAPGSPCEQYLASLLRDNPRCYDCLLQFIGSDQALVKCVAPYLDATCNHDLTCALACSNRSCGQCSASLEEPCRSAAFESGGQCSTWVNGYFCLEAAWRGPATFCQFNDDVGAWIQTVGTQYCGR